MTKISLSKNAWITRKTLQLQGKLRRLKNKKARNLFCSSLDNSIATLATKLKLQTWEDKAKYYGVSLPFFIKASPETFWRSIKPSSCSSTSFSLNGHIITEDTALSAFQQTLDLYLQQIMIFFQCSVCLCHLCRM